MAARRYPRSIDGANSPSLVGWWSHFRSRCAP
jgi:hypothetical protein